MPTEPQFPYNLRLPGQYFMAETGLNQNTARDYDPLVGRYVEPDPIGQLFYFKLTTGVPRFLWTREAIHISYAETR
jgi:RHS repeat-associated protein